MARYICKYQDYLQTGPNGWCVGWLAGWLVASWPEVCAYLLSNLILNPHLWIYGFILKFQSFRGSITSPYFCIITSSDEMTAATRSRSRAKLLVEEKQTAHHDRMKIRGENLIRKQFHSKSGISHWLLGRGLAKKWRQLTLWILSVHRFCNNHFPIHCYTYKEREANLNSFYWISSFTYRQMHCCFWHPDRGQRVLHNNSFVQHWLRFPVSVLCCSSIYFVLHVCVSHYMLLILIRSFTFFYFTSLCLSFV